MERLTAYDRPFHGRADNMILGPLNPAEAAGALGLDGADAIGAHLMTGGLPGIPTSWPSGMSPSTFLETESIDPAGPVFSIPEPSLLAEFANPDHARRVIEAVGSGDRTHAPRSRPRPVAAAGGRQGPVPSGSLSPMLHRLVEEKRVLAVDHPLSTKPGRPALYRIADSNLRFYLAMGRAAQEQARRGRPDASIEVLRRRFTSWRGRAVEPLVREALELAAIAHALPWPEVSVVGGWWNRSFDPEIDLVGADRGPVAQRIDFAGSIKWISSPFDGHDLATLRHSASRLPGLGPEADLMVVALSGVTGVWGPRDVVAAWSSPPPRAG